MRKKVRLSLVISIFFFSMIFIPYYQVESQDANFSLRVKFLVEDIRMDGISQIIAKSWAPLYIEVNRQGIPRPVYRSQLDEDSWDIMIISQDFLRKDAPPLQNIYSPNSPFGSNIYHFKDAERMTSAGIEVDTLDRIIENYHYAKSIDSQIASAKEFQNKYIEWLFDIPLVSKSRILSQWADFKGFNKEEGIIKSIFLGAYWQNNPRERSNIGRKDNEIHYPLTEYNEILNPLFYKSKSDLLVLESLYSSLFLIDKNGNPHPNLAISYSYDELENGGSLWQFTLRNDSYWSDGVPITTKDIEFTFEMNNFDWIGSTNHNYWKDLKQIISINNTDLTVEFERRTQFDYFTIGSAFIIPEHILNETFTFDNIQYTPYEGVYPVNSPEWISFNISPITSGPYNLKNAKSGEIITVTQNTNYWYPSELDLPDQKFNIYGIPRIPYYFITPDPQNPLKYLKQGSLNISTIVFHIGGSGFTDINIEITLFENGRVDFLDLEFLSIDNSMLTDKNFIVHKMNSQSQSIILLVNLKNSNLQQYNIRKALSHAIFRDDVLKIHGYGARLQKTPVPPYYSDYYDDSNAIDYNYELARDLFRENGLNAKDTTEVEEGYRNPIDDIYFFDFLSISLTYIIFVFFHKKKIIINSTISSNRGF